jgi:hypothetical protein
MKLLEENETDVAADALAYVRDLVTILARYHRDLGMTAPNALRAALREFEAEYPDEIRILETEETDDG